MFVMRSHRDEAVAPAMTEITRQEAGTRRMPSFDTDPVRPIGIGMIMNGTNWNGRHVEPLALAMKMRLPTASEAMRL